MVDPQQFADVAWMLTATALVLVMFPGLAFLYGGVAGNRNVLNLLMMVMVPLGTVGVFYMLFGHGMVLGDSLGGIIGNPFSHVGLIGAEDVGVDGGISASLDVAFFTLFCCISVALVASGALGRMKFSAWLVFSLLWGILVYMPLAHWTFGGGWMQNVLPFHDYAGGMAIHMSAGFGALALAKVLGPRKDVEQHRPHNIPLVLLGAGLMWMGWFGFNGGTAGGANYVAQYALSNSLYAGATGMVGYMLFERLRFGKATALGMSTGLIAGLVGITPAADMMDPMGASVLGLLSGCAAAWACTWKSRHKIDESLDAFPVHGIAGITGSLCMALFGWGTYTADEPFRGVLFGGSPLELLGEIAGIIITCAWAFGVTWLIATLMHKTVGIRVADDEENDLDLNLHGETAYTTF